MVIENAMERQPEMPAGAQADVGNRRHWWSSGRPVGSTSVARRVLAGRPASDGVPRRALPEG